MIGETLGRYRIIEHLGSGGMAEVYKAYHPGLDRYVAVKVLHPFLAQEEDFLTRFQREAKAVAALRHPNIVQVFDFDYDQELNIYYMVMEFIDGPSFKVRLKELGQRGERMGLDEAVRIVAAVGEALDYAHRRGMVHRDVKPANVMFNSEEQTILTDFGIAKMINVAELTASGSMVGTPAYMAPEQGMGQAGDERSDIYSLGAMLYQLVTGILPFEADTPMGVVLKHISEPLPSPRAVRSDLPLGLEQVIVRAMAKNPAQRYQTAAELVADLRRAATGAEIAPLPLDMTIATDAVELTMPVDWPTPVPGYPPPPPSVPGRATVPPSAPASKRRWRWLIFGLAAVLFLLLVGSGMLFFVTRPAWLFGAVTQTATSVTTPTPNLPATHIAATMEAIQATLDAPTATLSPTAVPSPTPDRTATAEAACVLDVEVTEDLPVLPVVLAPDQPFTKRWVVRNSGTCAWRPGLELVFTRGDQMGGPATLEVEAIDVGGEWEVTLNLAAPAEYGTYTGVWQFQDEEGNSFGELLVTVQVGPTPTPPPPTATPTPEFTPTPVQPLEMSYPSLTSCWADPDTGQWGGRIAWSAWGGPNAEYHFFYGSVVSEQELAEPFDDFTTQVDRTHRMSYFCTAGVGVFWPLPEDCCPGPQGRYVSPEGNEVVWWTVQYSQADCP